MTSFQQRFAAFALCAAFATACGGGEGPPKAGDSNIPSAVCDDCEEARPDAPDAEESNAPAAVCDGCDQAPFPGGDTSDVGGPRPCGGDIAAQEPVSLSEARALGFDPDEALAGVEGTYAAPIRWTDDDSETVLTVSLRRTDRATIIRWDKMGLDDADAGVEAHSCHPGDYLLVDTAVEFASADGRVAGSFEVVSGPGYYGQHTIKLAPFGGVDATNLNIDGITCDWRGSLDLGESCGQAAAVLVAIDGYQFGAEPARLSIEISLRRRRPEPVVPPDNPWLIDSLLLGLAGDGCRPWQVRPEPDGECVHRVDLEAELAAEKDAGLAMPGQP